MVISREDRVGVRSVARLAGAYRAANCPVGKEVNPELKENEPWRRITGITVLQEAHMDVKERRAGLRDLVRWIREFTIDDLRLTIGAGSAKASARAAAYSMDGYDGENAPSEVKLFSSDFTDEDEIWASEGRSVELIFRICTELNITRNKLTELIKEVRGVSATELIDGFRINCVKHALSERVKLHARELWMAPGLYANVLISDERLHVYGGGNSDYFVDPDEKWRRRELWETRAERKELLLAEYDAGWRRGDSSRDGFACGLGFRNFGELNRACLNTYGKSARQVVWDLCGEIIDYYLAREIETVRELACCERVTPGVARARYLYRGDTARPEGDGARVSALWDALDGDWREGMGRWLG